MLLCAQALAASAEEAAPAAFSVIPDEDGWIRMPAVLEAFGQAFVELRKGHDQFSSEMALRNMGELTELHTATDARAVLRYLLDRGVDINSGAQHKSGLLGGTVLNALMLRSSGCIPEHDGSWSAYCQSVVDTARWLIERGAASTGSMSTPY